MLITIKILEEKLIYIIMNQNNAYNGNKISSLKITKMDVNKD